MRWHVWALLFILLSPSWVTVAGTGGRAMTTDVSVQRYDWFSNETVIIDFSLRDAPYQQSLTASWSLFDEDGVQLLNGTYRFQAAGTFTVFEIHLEAFYSGSHFHSYETEIRAQNNDVIGEATVEFMVFEQVMMPNVATLLSFGDSLSDMGNAKNSFLNTPDVPPYWQGRFSNGEVWFGYMDDAYGTTVSIGSGTGAGDNRAFGGAQTGSGYAYLVIPNVGTQITNYLGSVQSTIPSNAVVSLWAGGNDFLYGTANANTISANMESHIRQLHGAGANTLIVPNLPPLEMTPEILSRSASQQATIRDGVIDYNSKLNTIVADLRIELGMTIHTIDAWSIFHDIVLHKEALGLTNTQDAACAGGSTLLPLPICNSASTIAPYPDEYLFFDKAHPTRVMHKFIARYAVESIGTPDRDGDGIVNSFDECPWTDEAEQANQQGCSWNQLDDDSDGITNGLDACPNTATGDVVDATGCSAVQRDSDGDGLNDFVDPCPFSPSLNDYDSDGCSNAEDDDDDNDGVLDDVDDCPQGSIGFHLNDLDEDGCSDSEDLDIDGDGLDNIAEGAVGSDPLNPDTDGDTYLDGEDLFPLDPNEWSDIDLDGCGDNGDQFPFDRTECLDSDKDGYGDNADRFPNDESEWVDSDDDGIGDNGDACFLLYGLSLYPPGCPDRDGDGYADVNDRFPNDGTEWNDTDADGFGDNSDLFPNDATDWEDKDNDTYGDNRDAFPSDPNEWNDTDGEGVGDNADIFPEDPSEWIDTDGDGCGDNGDVFPNDPGECLDSDVDGVGDNADAFPNSAYEWLDSDGDGLGDNADKFPFDAQGKYDADGDGIANALDTFPNQASLDSWLDVIIRLVLLIALIGAGGFYFKRNRTSDGIDSFGALNEFHQEALLTEASKPLAPPPMDTFSAPVPSEHEIPEPIEHAPYPYLPPPKV
ncbi:SGNH/GDSL hydrolase family protein [Candidatus Poseidonia alphae]|nr:SGNH/GDSL hydrolase family protein [Candidatus Poseidonia alphae]